MMNTQLKVSRLKELLEYDPISGEFTWVAPPGCSSVKPGDRAGTIEVKGYRAIMIDGRRYKAHRLAWLWTYGSWPVNELDHINGIKTDNRIENLRDVTSSINQQNRTRAPSNNHCGLLGVRPFRGKWQARINVDGETLHLGTFDTPEMAHSAYIAAKAKFHAGYVPVQTAQSQGVRP